MDILEKAKKILAQPVCDHCLGRQFGQLLSGYGNGERGVLLRTLAAMSIDNEKENPGMDVSNFYGFKFHNLDIKPPKGEKCSVCNGFFSELDEWAKKLTAAAKKYEFATFLTGTKLSFDLVTREEELWERIGIDYCEPLKAEINREVGKRIEKIMHAKFNPKTPDVNLILDIENKKAAIEVNPFFVYGEYQKLVRGIPQTKWPSGKYKTSVEQIVAKPFMLASKGKGHKLHGLGREDIDARCLGWRPFVLEILEPRKRKLDIRKLARRIAKGVRVRNIRYSSIQEVRKIKETKLDKSYRCTVVCDKEVPKKDLKKLGSLKLINQKTPQRVLHRRADRMRKKNVRQIKARLLAKKKFEIIVKGEAGLYIKELVSGDNGRTKPSVSEVLGCNCVAKDLDVIMIHKK